ncbi:MAG: ABC transporter ATP-binding protein [Clostridia bacterium]|nr:ABC transporter ATP-binding protein [Clostridia bacterium]
MLSIKELSKSYGEKKLFENFSYEFPNAGVYVISGNSGIGKTTLLRMIAGLDTSYKGKIIGGGTQNVSFAFQEYRLFPELTALQNAFFANSDTKSEAECKSILFSLGFTDVDINLLPNELSGGMKQRVSLARAFLKDAPILLLDEPTKELDPQNVDLVYRQILMYSKNKLVIIVSHNEDDAVKLNAEIIKLKN